MVASKLSQARIRVWARVPTLNLTWAWQQHPEWRIAAGAPPSRQPRRPAGAPQAAADRWPTRLAPDLPEAKRAAIDFVSDLAVYAPLDGVVFDDDAAMGPGESLVESRAATTADKAAAIDDLLARCRDAVRAWRPECRFARIVDATVVEAARVQPELAQDFSHIMRDNDLTVVNAPPDRPGADSRLRAVGRRAVARWRGLGRGARGPVPVLLSLQVSESDTGRGVSGRRLRERAATALSSGVGNLGVRPVAPDGGDLPEGLLDAGPLIGPVTGEQPVR